MTTYEALLEEIALIQSARDTLPDDAHVRTLFDIAIRRLCDCAEAIERRRARGSRANSPFTAAPQCVPPPNLAVVS
jgi:hypothetical protein